MANGNIAISQEAVQTVLKRLRLLVENSSLEIRQTKQSVLDAELRGWSDSSYVRFEERFSEIMRRIEDSLRECEDVLIADLVRLNNSIEHF